VEPKAPPAEGPVDVWWGSYSGWTMLPGWIACGLFALAVAGICWYWQIRGILRLTLQGIALLIVLLQFVRWGNRTFGYNYRLTTRYFFQERRVFARRILRVEIASLSRVLVERNQMERLLGVGRLLLEREGGETIVLEGIRDADRVAEIFRCTIEAARDSQGA
jgi:hypothetical protein